jgi:hypothetical protein
MLLSFKEIKLVSQRYAGFKILENALSQRINA